jgi:hypothetical protein
LSAFCGLLVGDLQQLQDDRLVLAQHLARGDAEQQGIADLAGGAGDGHADGLLAHGRLLEGGSKEGERVATPAEVHRRRGREKGGDSRPARRRREPD